MSTKREVTALLPTGNWIVLGQVVASEEEIQELLNAIVNAYRRGKGGFFTLGYAVYNTASFAGVRVSPPPK